MTNAQINSALVQDITELDALDTLELTANSLTLQNISISHLNYLESINCVAEKSAETSATEFNNNQDFRFPTPSTLDFSLSTISISSVWKAGHEIIGQQSFSNSVLLGMQDDHTNGEDHEDLFPISNGETLTAEGIITNNTVPTSTQNFSTFDFNNVFKLHSNPNAKHTIYLDFDGHTTVNTSWNSVTHPTIISPSFDTDGNTASFSVGELQTILGIWQRVTEDFAPFEVNVTTEAPNIADLQKSGTGDTRWGIRSLMTQNINLANNTAVFGSIGGVAYLNSFNASTDLPLFSFNKGENNAAMTASHEIGHSLGLNHDGQVDSNPLDTVNDSKTYHSGFGTGDTSWGALLGAPFGKNLTQWSKGDYQYANNQEDDLAIITTRNGFDYRLDDYGSTISTATNLIADNNGKISAFGMIERNTDKDVFAFTTGTGNISLNIAAASRSYISDSAGNYDVKYLDARGSNIDLWAGIYNSNGILVAESNPVDLLSASFTNFYLTAGSYYLQIDGVGKTGLNGYSDYGSLGQYTIDGLLVKNVVNTTPALTQALVDVAVIEDSVFTWSLPNNTFTDSDAGDVLSYSAKLADGRDLPTWLTFDAATQTLSGTPDNNQVGSIDIKIIATDAAGATAEDIFSITIQNANDAPVLVTGLVDQVVNANAALNFTLPVGAFADADAGDLLSYTATLANGSALPSWLSFNSVTKTFTGQPTLENSGLIDIKVLASDSSGAQASDNFTILVKTGLSDIKGDEANNRLTGSTKADYIQGFEGNDSLYGLGGSDYLDGGIGNDYLEGASGADTLVGGTGDDTYYLIDNDVIIESADGGIDLVLSGINYTLGSNLENLTLRNNATGTGNDADNRITAGGGKNTLFGGAGNDYLNGGNGNDTMNGGAGVDTFVLNAPQVGVDTLSDFTTGIDKISIVAGLYGGGLVAGDILASNQLLIGTGSRATTADQRFIYKNTTGELFFDGDGSLAGLAAQKIAVFSNFSSLSTTDFLVV
jgi:Ca2+-binding RTX toxin-like protein